MTTLPPALRPGDTIALVAPSGRLNHLYPARIARAKTALGQLGFRVKEIYTALPAGTSYAEAVKLRCGEIHEAFADAVVKGVFCVVGGLSVNELLSHIDYALIRANPKVFCGYSDITLLHHALYSHANLRTFYGPAAITQWAEFPSPHPFTASHFTHVLCSQTSTPASSPSDLAALPPVGPMPRSAAWTQEFLDWDTGADSTRPRTMTPNPGWKWLRPGTATGKIMGGCLPSINQIVGTPFFPAKDYAGCLLLLELPDWDEADKGMPVDFARSALVDLGNAASAGDIGRTVGEGEGVVSGKTKGILGNAAGVICGRPFKYSEADEKVWEGVLVEVCEAFGMEGPILAGVDVGHTDPMLTVPLGAMGRLDSGAVGGNGDGKEVGEWVVLEAGVKP